MSEHVVCIFCAHTDNEVQFNREHIIPQNIGGNLYLDDAVCVECNSKLGTHIDAETLKMPDILKAFEVLNIPHDHAGILNRHYDIMGKTEDIELRFGKVRGQGYSFPKQRLADGSLITPERDYFAALKQEVKRDKRLREVGLSKQEVQARFEELRRLYEQAEHGDEVAYPEFGVTLRKRSDRLLINIAPREQANIQLLIAKIAYEIIFFCGGPEFFSIENLDLQQQLLTSIDQKEIQKGINVIRVEPTIKEFRRVHLIRLEVPNYVTIVRVAFFGHIEYVLTAKPLSRALVGNLKEKLNVDDLYAIAYQQELDKPTKSFWAVAENGKVDCIAAV
jgi:hypothetical protein